VDGELFYLRTTIAQQALNRTSDRLFNRCMIHQLVASFATSLQAKLCPKLKVYAHYIFQKKIQIFPKSI